MFPEALREHDRAVYRRRMRTLLGIPEDATGRQIHDSIVAGFPAARLVDLCEQGEIAPRERDWIIPLRTLRRRAVAGQRLTGEESERLFRAVHITVSAESLFGEGEVARRWLSRPMRALGGRTSYAMIQTTPGMHLVEERIMQGIEGIYA